MLTGTVSVAEKLDRPAAAVVIQVDPKVHVAVNAEHLLMHK